MKRARALRTFSGSEGLIRRGFEGEFTNARAEDLAGRGFLELLDEPETVKPSEKQTVRPEETKEEVTGADDDRETDGGTRGRRAKRT